MRMETLLSVFWGCMVLLLTSGCEFDAAVSDNDSGPTVVYSEGAQATPEQRFIYDVMVVDAANRPVPGAQVSLWLEDSGETIWATTGMEGVVSFDFAATPGAALYISAQSGRHLPAAVTDRTGMQSYQTYILTMAEQ